MQEDQEQKKPYLDQSQKVFNEAYEKLEKFLYKNKTEDGFEFNELKINGRRLFIDGRQSINDKILPF